jgi:hypothetical protein
MIDGIYNLEIKFGEEHVQGVAKVKGNSIKGLDSDRVYVVEFSGQHGKSCWRFSASRYGAHNRTYHGTLPSDNLLSKQRKAVCI